MSGGSYNYTYYTVENEYGGRMYDIELNELILDLVPVVKALEWWQSGDTGEERYRETVAKFKNKWFGVSRSKRLEALVNKEIDKLRTELKAMIGEEKE